MANSSANNNISEASEIVFETTLTRIIKFSVLVSLEIPSCLCFLFIFSCFIKERELRRWQNHFFIALSICNFCIVMIELPITLAFFYNGHVQVATTSFCYYWTFLNYTLYGISLHLIAGASFERYIIILWSNYFYRGVFYRRLSHYVLLTFSILFAVVWYIALIFFFQCPYQFDFNFRLFVCGGACYQSIKFWSTIDWILMSLLPVIITTVVNILLVGQVSWGKRHVQQAFFWRKMRKMIIQLSATVILYLATQIPLSILSIIGLLNEMSEQLTHVVLVWLYYLPYLVCLFSPFSYMLTTKECAKHIRRFINSLLLNNQIRPIL